MNCFVMKFKNRDAQDISNRNFSDIYTNGPKFDLELVSSDNKIICAHKIVVFMFSKYLRDYLFEFKSKGKSCVPLPDCSAFVLQQVIDLFYKGQIMVAAEVKPRIENALRFLQVADIVVQNAATPQNSSTDDNGQSFNTMPSKPSSISGVPNSNQQIMKRELSSNSIQQYNSQQPTKRPRPQQSAYLDSSSNGLGQMQSTSQPFQLGSLTISKAKATSMTTT